MIYCFIKQHIKKCENILEMYSMLNNTSYLFLPELYQNWKLFIVIKVMARKKEPIN